MGPDDHAEVAVNANTRMTRKPPINLNNIPSFSKWVRAIPFCLPSKYKSQSKSLLVVEMQRADERVAKLIQRESFLELFSEKESFGKIKKDGIYQNLHPF